ncbi:metallophosphoesterase [Phytoactinopolyspora mesophila]
MMIGLTGLALGGLAYAAGYEVRSYRLRRFEVPVLPPGSRPIRVLHVSDLHMTPNQQSKIEWVRGLAALEPDLVVNTGDNLAHSEAVSAVLYAFEPLLSRPGVFVFGSNDYYSPRPKNPAAYLLPTRGAARVHQPDLPWRDLRDGLTDAGWLDLTNARGDLTVADHRLSFAGVDDPHLGRDRYNAVAGPPVAGTDLAIGVTHAPYLRVLDAMAADGYRLLLAGHTHGGQLCVPGYGALVTNCDLDTDRVKGVSRHPADGGPDTAWMHVSAGLGTSPYTPVRFACPPEASLLKLVARP